MRERIKWVDTAKGIAIILVVVGHVVQSYHNVNQYTASTLFNFSGQFVYSFHMALFMMLSGMLFTMSYNGAIRGMGGVKTVANKLIAYGVPYIVFSIVWWSFKMIFSGHVNSTLTVEDLLLIPIFPISFMWFIYALLIMVIIQQLIGENFSKRHVAFLQITIALLSKIYYRNIINWIDYPGIEDCIIFDVMRNYIYYVIGVYFCYYIKRLVQCKWNLLIAFASFVALVLINVATFNHIIKMTVLLSMTTAIVGSISLMTFCKWIEDSNWLNYVGRNSLSLFMCYKVCALQSHVRF